MKTAVKYVGIEHKTNGQHWLKVTVPNETFWAEVIDNDHLRVDNNLIYSDEHGLFCDDILVRQDDNTFVKQTKNE